MPDELNFVRVQMTKRYKKALEADQSVTWHESETSQSYLTVSNLQHPEGNFGQLPNIPALLGVVHSVQAKNGIFYALLPGLAITVIGISFFIMDALGMLDPQTKQMLDAVKGKGV